MNNDIRAHHCEKYFIPMFAITSKNNRLRCCAYEIETEREEAACMRQLRAREDPESGFMDISGMGGGAVSSLKTNSDRVSPSRIHSYPAPSSCHIISDRCFVLILGSVRVH